MILITGAAGFIGSNISKQLSETSLGPLVLCDWFGVEEKWRNVKSSSFVDIIRPDVLFDWLNKKPAIKAIVHMGAISATTESDVDCIIKNNVRLTLDLYHYCVENNIAFIYASSAATYGALEVDLFDSEDNNFLETLAPLNPYGWSKNIVDKIIFEDARKKIHHPQIVGLKFFNVYGPNEYHKGDMRSVVLKTYEAIRDRSNINLFKSYRSNYDDGEQCRDFVYVKDCALLVEKFLKNPNLSGIFNIGTGVARSFNDLVKCVDISMSTESKVDYIEMPPSLKGKYQYYTRAINKKVLESFPDFEFTTLEAGVDDYVKNYLITENKFR